MSKEILQDSFYFTDSQGVRLFAQVSRPVSAARGIVQIAHGMRESTAYYREFREALTAAGYIVGIHDARGHGKTAGLPGSEEFKRNAGAAGEDSARWMVKDLKVLTEILKARNPGLPVYLLGHSMGSILARLYMARYGDELDGAILSGTAGPFEQKRLGRILRMARAEAARSGRAAPAVRAPELLFGHFNDRFQPVKTGYEYMSRDEAMVREAIGSPYTAIRYSNGFFVDFLEALRRAGSEESIGKIPTGLPIFSVSGSMDPFGEYGDGIKRLFELFRRNGIADASYKIYQGGRHEMLRETNRKDVFSDIIAWLGAHGGRCIDPPPKRGSAGVIYTIGSK
ncbi:MAG: alpha/beta hydrolase [Clostridia bacterium]|nr:alpha/beta hydrolase [Clostridia bacterium]